MRPPGCVNNCSPYLGLGCCVIPGLNPSVFCGLGPRALDHDVALLTHGMMLRQPECKGRIVNDRFIPNVSLG